jgi:uncharacterized protein (DUF2147 family)
MFSLVISAVASVVVAHAAGAASPAEGFWQAASGGAVIEVHSCGDALCGRVVDSADLRINPYLTDDTNKDPTLRGRPVKGMDILQGFKPQGVKGGQRIWTDGLIYNPADGRVYHAEVKLIAPDRLKVTGCVLFPLCGSQVWRKQPNDSEYGRGGGAASTAK